MFSPIVPVSCFSESASVPASPNFAAAAANPRRWRRRRRLVPDASSVSAICSTVWPNASLRATKSVSLFSSTIAPVVPSGDVCATILPSEAARPARRLAARDPLLAQPLDRLRPCRPGTPPAPSCNPSCRPECADAARRHPWRYTQPLLVNPCVVVETPPEGRRRMNGNASGEGRCAAVHGRHARLLAGSSSAAGSPWARRLGRPFRCAAIASGFARRRRGRRRRRSSPRSPAASVPRSEL